MTDSPQFVVHSRPGVERMDPPSEPFAIISITSGPTDQAVLPEGDRCQGILRLSFLDIEDSLGDWVEDGLFSDRQAHQIWDFALRHAPGVQWFVVHCDAGMSRSPAVAAALAHGLGLDPRPFFFQFVPNMHVYRTMVDVYERSFAQP
jgi:predicted protein tyrosine phosphatase